MTRLLWSAVAALAVIAIGAPGLTFYLVVKEYWTDVGSLRHELLICQLSSSSNAAIGRAFPVLESFGAPSGDGKRGGEEEESPSLPLPARLTSGHPRTNTFLPNSILTNGLTDVSFIKNTPYYPSTSIFFKKDKNIEDKMLPYKLPNHNKQLSSFVKATKAPSIRNSLTEDSAISQPIQNQATRSRTSSKDENIVCLSEDYVNKLEKRVIDLKARVSACRRCLDSAQQKASRCGGGSSWREHRRKEKLARREMREEKKKRREKQKKMNELLKLEASMADVTFPHTTSKFHAESGSNSDESQVDISSLFGLRYQNSQNSPSSHNMRETHRASTDFRRGFNQKILRMNEALMQFTETQSAFCKGLRDNLGASLEKRGQELEALSEQIASLVRITTSQVAMMEKFISDQVYVGQTRIKKNLDALQTMRDEEVRTIQAFHKKTFLPAMVTLTSLLGEQASSVTNMGVDLITKVEMLQDFFRTFSTQQRDTLVKLSEEIDMFTSKHGNLIMRSKDHAKHLHMNTENFIRELQTRMNNVVKELVLVRLQSQSFISVNEETYHEISVSLNKTTDVADALSSSLERRIEESKTKEGDFRKEFRQETETINTRIQTGISEMLMENHDAVTRIGEIELETRMSSNAASLAWKELYVNQETELREEADMLGNSLQNHNHHTQNILTGLQGTAGTHEQVLEQQRMDFQSFVRKRQDALDSQCSSISDWAFLMSSELRMRDEDLHKFLNEDLHFSPVTAQGIAEYDDFLASRLPDGTLLYDSSSSNSFHSRGISSSNGTSESVREASETLKGWSISSPLNSSSADRSSSHNSLLSKSKRVRSEVLFLPPPKERRKGLIILDTSKKNENGTNGVLSEIMAENKTYITGDKPSSLETGSDVLSIRIVARNDQNRKIIPQKEQPFLANSTVKVGCINKYDRNFTNILFNKTINNAYTKKIESDDEEFQELQRILLEAKMSILKMKKEFNIKENFRELKKNILAQFSEDRNKTFKKTRLTEGRLRNDTANSKSKTTRITRSSPSFSLLLLPPDPTQRSPFRSETPTMNNRPTAAHTYRNFKKNIISSSPP